MVQSFGIPDQAAAVSALNAGIADNTRLLSSIATTAVVPVTTAVGVNAAFLDRLRSTLVRSLAGRAAANQRLLSEVQAAATTNLTAQVGANQARLAETLVAVQPETHWYALWDPEIGWTLADTDAAYAARFERRGGPFASRQAALDYISTAPPVPTPGPTPPPVPGVPPIPPPRKWAIYQDLATGRYTYSESVGEAPAGSGQRLVAEFSTQTQAVLRLLQLQPRTPAEGTTPPLPSPPPSNAPWYIFCVTPGDRDSITVHQTDNPLSIHPEIPERAPVGPFSTRAEALAFIASDQVWTICGPAPVPPPPPPVTVPGGNGQIPPVICPLPPPIAEPPPPEPEELPGPPTCPVSTRGQLPAVGSPEFCACIDDFRAWLAATGQWFVDTVLGASQGGVYTEGWIDPFSRSLLGFDRLPFGIGQIGIGARFKSMIQGVKPLWESLHRTVLAAPLCNPAELLAIQLCRSLLASLSEVRIGVNLGLEFTVVLSVRVHQLERLITYVQDYICPTEVPSVPEAMECLFRNTAPREQVRCWLAMRGVDITVWEPVLRARRDTLSPAEWIQFVRRTLGIEADVETQVAALRNVGWTDPDEARARVELYDELPSVTDHLHWTARNVFDRNYVDEFELLEGFAEKFWPEFGPDLRALGMKERYAQLHYAAHWINPSPEQLKEMVYRLRPEKVGADLGFTLEQYRRVLQEKDVGPFFQRRFQAIAYRVPALSYLRDMYRAGVITEADLKGYHQDLGYSEVDSERFVGIDRLLKTRIRTQQAHGWTPPALASAFGIGVLTERQVRDEMAQLGYSELETTALLQRSLAEVRRTVLTRAISRAITKALTQIENAQKAGVLDVTAAATAIVAVGFPAEKATAIAQATQNEANVALVRRATGRIRSAWMAGQVDETYAKQSLVQLGLHTAAIEGQLTIWRVERTPNRRRRTALQVMDDWANEELAEPEAHARLHNLGYEEEDIRLFFRAAERKAKKAGERAARGAGSRAGRAAAPPAAPAAVSATP